jgi:chromosome segregation ATPase
MRTKSDYLTELQKKILAWRVDIEERKARAETLSTEQNRQLEEFQRRLHDLDRQIPKLQAGRDESWRELRDGLDDAWYELQETFDTIFSRER